MRKHWAIALVLACAAGAFAPGAAAGEKYALVKFVVVKDRNGKPIRNASVVLHEVNKDGRQEKGGMQLKTDNEGKTGFDGVPFGKLRVQVIAAGFQTFGQDFDVNQSEMQLNIRMKPPQEQVTIYDNKNPRAKPEEEKKPEAKPEEKKEVPK